MSILIVISFFLPPPSSILKYTFIPHIYFPQIQKDIDMVTLNHGFWELLPEDSMLFPEGEMNSDFTFIEVDIRERMFSVHCRIQSKSEFTNHDFSFCFKNKIINFLKHRWKMIRGENSSFFDLYQKRNTMNYFKSISWVGLYESFSRDRFKIEGLGKYLTDREGSAFVLTHSVVSCVSASSFYFSNGKNMTLRRMANRSQSTIDI